MWPHPALFSTSFTGMHQSRFHRLVLEEHKSGPVSVVVVRETAELFGWDTAFPEWNARFRDDYGPGRRVGRLSMADPRNVSGGRRLRICRSKTKNGHPRGSTHCFRLIGPWSNRHLIALAAAAGERFEWMEGKNHARISREKWLARAERVKPPAMDSEP